MGGMIQGTTQVEQLREEIRTVRESIIALVMQMDDIKLQQIPQIRADYALKIGCWEQALLEAELSARRARRRLALAQALANRGIAPNMGDIESQLDDELADWVAKVEQARLSFEMALSHRLDMTRMTRAATGELKRVYRMLVKRLHPDVCPGADEERAALFKLAQAAYRNGDVGALCSLEVATRHMDSGYDDLESTDDAQLLSQELEVARIEEDVMRQRLNELEESEEVHLRTLLSNPEWVTARTTELRRAVEEWERMRDEYGERLRKLAEDFDEH